MSIPCKKFFCLLFVVSIAIQQTTLHASIWQNIKKRMHTTYTKIKAGYHQSYILGRELFYETASLFGKKPPFPETADIKNRTDYDKRLKAIGIKKPKKVKIKESPFPFSAASHDTVYLTEKDKSNPFIVDTNAHHIKKKHQRKILGILAFIKIAPFMVYEKMIKFLELPPRVKLATHMIFTFGIFPLYCIPFSQKLFWRTARRFEKKAELAACHTTPDQWIQLEIQKAQSAFKKLQNKNPHYTSKERKRHYYKRHPMMPYPQDRILYLKKELERKHAPMHKADQPSDFLKTLLNNL